MESWDMVDMQNQFCADCVAEFCEMDRKKCIESEEARLYFKFFNKSYNLGGNQIDKIRYCLEDTMNKAIKKAPPALTGEAV